MPSKPAAGLPTEVVNDKGRNRQSCTKCGGHCVLQAVSLATEISKRSFTASCSFCLLPMYRSVVWTEAWPSRNRICSSSPLQSWQSRAQVRRRSWGARWGMPACRAHRLTAYQTTLAVTPASCRLATFETLLNTRPSLTPECESHASSNCLDHDGTGCSQPSSLTDQIDDDPASLPNLQLLQSQSDHFRTP
jgi:hypothetical protein